MALCFEAFLVDGDGLLVGGECAFVLALGIVKGADLAEAAGESGMFFFVVFLDEFVCAKDLAFGLFPLFEIGVGHAHVSEQEEEEGVAFGDDLFDASECALLEPKCAVVLLILCVEVGEVVFDGGDEGVIGALGLDGELDGALVELDSEVGLVVFSVGSAECVEDMAALGVCGVEVAVSGFVGAQKHLEGLGVLSAIKGHHAACAVKADAHQGRIFEQRKKGFDVETEAFGILVSCEILGDLMEFEIKEDLEADIVVS